MPSCMYSVSFQFVTMELGLFTRFLLAVFCSVSVHHLLTANNTNMFSFWVYKFDLTHSSILCDKFSLHYSVDLFKGPLKEALTCVNITCPDGRHSPQPSVLRA